MLCVCAVLVLSLCVPEFAYSVTTENAEQKTYSNATINDEFAEMHMIDSEGNNLYEEGRAAYLAKQGK